jgi:hypothetical protein
MPLIMHADDVDFGDKLAKWRTQNEGTKGDDRSPGWTWIGYLYHDDKHICVPSDNLMSCIMEGAACVRVGTGNKTYKSQSQSGMLVYEPFWEVIIDGNQVPMDEIRPMLEVDDFEEHQALVDRLGFSLFVKRAKVGQSKHVRVRPYFERWAAAGTIKVWDDAITTEVLQSILHHSGTMKGIGDWRPSSKTPGRFGTFDAQIEQVK